MSTRVAIIERPDGRVQQHAFVCSDIERAQQRATEWLDRMMRPHYHSRFKIVNEEYCPLAVPMLRIITRSDREFLAACGVSADGL